MTEFTVGVEEEFHLVNADTGELHVRAGDVLARLTGPLDDEVEPELLRSQIETQTPVCSTLDEVRTELVRLRRDLAAAAGQAGCRIAASGTWPADTPPVPPTEKCRYEEIADRFGRTAREQTTCGCHVHVHVDNPDLAVAVIRRSRQWLPAVLAVSANSPFWRGADTTYQSYRSQVWARWPSAGSPPALRSAAEYDELVAALLATGVPRDEGMIYWDARKSRQFGTVEFRVADVCLRVDHALLLTALLRGLAQTAVAAEQAARGYDDERGELIRAAQWRAARYGVEGELVDPTTGRPAPAGNVVRGLVDHVRPALEDHGDAEFVDDAVSRLLTAGAGARQQRAVYRRAGHIDDVVRMIVDETESPT